MGSEDALFFAWFTIVLGCLIFVTVLPALIFAQWMLRKTERSLMLVLKRKPNQSILIGENIRIVVVSVDQGGGVKLGIEAPNDVNIVREEILEEERRNKQAQMCSIE